MCKNCLLCIGSLLCNRPVLACRTLLIIRGKETKTVEFGAKVNVLQIDGINFIEHLSYDAFNEGTRLQSGIFLQRKLFGKCTHQSADQIYATNANRKYCKQNN